MSALRCREKNARSSCSGPPPGPPPTDLKDYEFIEQKREKMTARKSVRFADAGGDEDKGDWSSSESEDESGSEEEGEGEDSTKQVRPSLSLNYDRVAY